MKAALLAVFLAVPAAAGPMGEAHVAAPTGFPGAYVGMVGVSLGQDPFYGSRLLDSFELHLRSVAAMTSTPAVKDYLEVAVVGAGGANTAKAIRASLGKEAMEPQRAAAILLANALARPEQFREVLDGLESRKAGLGKQTAKLLRDADGTGDRRLIAALRQRGAVNPRSENSTYDRFGRLDSLFDGAGLSNGDSVEIRGTVSVPDGYTGYGPDGRPRSAGVLPSRRE